MLAQRAGCKAGWMQGGELTETEIDQLVAKHPLPEGVPDCVLNREEMAEALATSLPTVTAWINAGMPVQQTGGNGKAYELRLSHCFAWNEARKASENLRSQEARSAIAAMRLALVGGKSGTSIEALDPKTRREIIAAQIEDERFRAQRNQLIPRDQVRELLEELFVMFRDTLESAPDRVERAVEIPAKAVNTLVEVNDGLLNELRAKIESFWSLRPERADTPVKEDLFDA